MAKSTSVTVGDLGVHGVSIEARYEVLSKYVADYEVELKNSIEGLAGKKSNEVDQGTLMNVQAKVQTWGTIVTSVTGALRAIADGLKSTTQNIR
jgi:hypothetical protein